MRLDDADKRVLAQAVIIAVAITVAVLGLALLLAIAYRAFSVVSGA